MIISFFGHDADDTTILKRVVGFQRAGFEVKGYMMRRGEDQPRVWDNVDLGRTFDANYFQRVQAIFRGAEVCGQFKHELQKTDVLYARNLDMLFCAFLVKERLKLTVPVIYECLDIHHLSSSSSIFGMIMRWFEKGLIKKTSLLVYSSPAFEREFFAVHYKNQYKPFLLENRLADDTKLPQKHPSSSRVTTPLKVGWYGILRCARTLSLLEGLAIQFPQEIKIICAGKPAFTQVPDFHERIEARVNMEYLGPYKAPDDLASLYSKVDIVWAGDFYQAGHNSKWLLPNRIYEGGYYGVPAIAPDDCETGTWVKNREAGFTVTEPIEQSLPQLISQIIENPSQLKDRIESLSELPRETFIQSDEVLKTLIETALEGKK